MKSEDVLSLGNGESIRATESRLRLDCGNVSRMMAILRKSESKPTGFCEAAMTFLDKIIRQMGFKGKDSGGSGPEGPTKKIIPEPTKIRNPRSSTSSSADMTRVFNVGERILDRYEVRSRMEGGFGFVYLCLDHQYQLPIAIKTLKYQEHPSVSFEDLLDKFYLEARTWVDLEKHPNIVQAKGVEKIDGQPFILLEYVAGDQRFGPSLSDWIAKQGRLGFPVCINFGVQFCRGMEHAERIFNSMDKPFVHRDIKPDNTLVTQDGFLKITDFGLAKIFGDSERDIFAGAGTPQYMAPEQFDNSDEVDTCTDIYSFGCQLYAMLAGHPPFRCGSAHEYQYHHQNTQPEVLDKVVQSIPESLSDIVLRCLEKKKEDRYQTFTEIKLALDRLYTELMDASLPEGTPAELESWERINKGVALNRLGYRQQALLEYLAALESDPNAAPRLFPVSLTHEVKCHCPAERQPKMVFHIQSIYTSYSQQKGMATLIDMLVSQYGVKVITVEGGTGKIDLSFYHNLPDKKRKEQIADQLLKQSKIQGHEYFAISTDNDISFYGAEEPGMHEEHTRLLLASLEGMRKWAGYCQAVERALISLKPYVYNTALMGFEEQKKLMEHKSIFLPFLKTMLNRLGVADKFPNMELMLRVSQIEIRGDSSEVRNEHVKLVHYLQQNLVEGQLEGLMKSIQDLQRNEISEHHYYGYLKQFVARHFPPAILEQYPRLNSYIDKVMLNAQLSPLALFSFEMPKAERRIRERLYDSPAQQELDRHLRDIDLLSRGFQVKLTPDEFDYLQTNREKISSQNIVGFIRGQAASKGISVTSSAPRSEREIFLPENVVNITENMQGVDSFYSQAQKRSRKLVENCLNYMDTEDESAGILAAGGFHTRFIEKYLRDQKIPYVVLSPKSDLSDDSQERYLGVITGQNSP